MRVFDILVETFNSMIVFSLSFMFSCGFWIESISFCLQQVIDDFNNGTNELLVSLNCNFLGHLHKNLINFSVGVSIERSEGWLSVSSDLSEDFVGVGLEEWCGLKGNNQGTCLLKGIDHCVVVASSLSIVSNSFAVSIVGIIKVNNSLVMLGLLIGLVILIRFFFKIENWEILISLSDLSLFTLDLRFHRFSSIFAFFGLSFKMMLSVF